MKYGKGPTIDEATGKPRIKGNQVPTETDNLTKGVKPEIIGPAIKLECHTCGYGSVRDPWHGYFLIVSTPTNEKRAEKGSMIMCPSCRHNDVTGIKDESTAIEKLTREQQEAHAKLLEQEVTELRRQNEILRNRAGVTPEKKANVEKGQHVK